MATPDRRSVEHFVLDHLAVFAGELDGQLALAGEAEIGGLVLVAEGVAADDDRLRPARHEARHVAAYDRLAEDHPAEDVADGAVGRLPHLLELEFLDALLVRRDGGAFHADADLFDRIGAVDRYLVVGLIANLHRKVEIAKVDVEIGMNEAVADEVPHDARHLVTVEFDDRIFNLDLSHVYSRSSQRSHFRFGKRAAACMRDDIGIPRRRQ